MDNINGINRYHIPTINNNLGTRNYPAYSVQNHNNNYNNNRNYGNYNNNYQNTDDSCTMF